jgi:hypothetical protein
VTRANLAEDKVTFMFDVTGKRAIITGAWERGQ